MKDMALLSLRVSLTYVSVPIALHRVTCLEIFTIVVHFLYILCIMYMYDMLKQRPNRSIYLQYYEYCLSPEVKCSRQLIG